MKGAGTVSSFTFMSTGKSISYFSVDFKFDFGIAGSVIGSDGKKFVIQISENVLNNLKDLDLKGEINETNLKNDELRKVIELYEKEGNPVLVFLALISINCKSNSDVDSLSDIDIVKLLDLKFEKGGSLSDFDQLTYGYYYFISTNCSACLDLELSKIDKYNSLSDQKIHLVIFDDQIVSRLTQFLKYTSIYKVSESLSDFGFVIEKEMLMKSSLLNWSP